MIPELFALAAWAQEAPPPAEEAEPAPAPADPATEPVPDGQDGDLAKYRAPFEVLSDRTIGTTSSPVEFNWRRTKVHVGGQGAFLAELNNFNTLTGGAVVRLPTDGLLFGLGLGWSEVWDTPSSELLALTPYRQPGRPSRVDLDVTVGIPLAEGIVTVAPRWFPAVQLVFQGYAGVRYSLYPTGFRGLSLGQVAGAVLSPQLRQEEVDNLERARLDAMEVDRGRYGLVAGLGNDLYFKRGLFVSPRVLFAVPLLAPASGTELYFWMEPSLALGVAL